MKLHNILNLIKSQGIQWYKQDEEWNVASSQLAILNGPCIRDQHRFIHVSVREEDAI